eukprot:749815-Hanusia_phi.AAC.1
MRQPAFAAAAARPAAARPGHSDTPGPAEPRCLVCRAGELRTREQRSRTSTPHRAASLPNIGSSVSPPPRRPRTPTVWESRVGQPARARPPPSPACD